jgi:hypothetical protein
MAGFLVIIHTLQKRQTELAHLDFPLDVNLSAKNYFMAPFYVESSWNVMAHVDAREGEVKGELANTVGSQYSSNYLGTRCIQHYYR